ncbi:MAG: class II glutamine amidotransferase [Bdellovibrionales bacterium]|nr:class II glutamine amidotransferase [Bdellovibrionales bacterium]NQZ18184.1 class II glutamine amidotransferase [Bdellovibrionales bacterium]
MCRIFGFRSVLQSGVHQSLIDADNAMIQQSQRHPDGWGVAYYKMGSPHVIKIDNQAKECKIFQKVSGVVSSNTVVTHIRKSTVGSLGALNTHPFQYGPWVFAHNGNVENFSRVRDQFLQKIDPDLRSFVLGDTDSEILFYLFLSLLKKRGEHALEHQRASDFPEILKKFVEVFKEVAGDLKESQGDYDKNYLTFLITNGKNMLAFQGGQKLYSSTHKTKCPESSTCSFYKPICEKLSQSGDKVHHLLVSSEIIKNENVWEPMSFGDYIGVGSDMSLFKGNIGL